ncbi:hypothetical protein FNV43_RR15113 [Rhamnella rubrinervis]|uniref:B-like cyclin n=1 Tax=Rhamnella rubrinervis TaxID=2594499 RepID=A0A8K0E186_9ROSA|nr:hypothetical protein FNV43_RR15113 [Rhamnella rubrinervis]
MAGFISGDPSDHGMYEGCFYKHGQEMPDDGARWYFLRKEIEENSPSRRDGIDLKKETYLRKSYCTFLQDLGMRLKVPQVTIATAIIFCHRFFLRQSHAKNDRRTIATVCMFLAGKVEETPRPLKDVILVSYEIIHKKDPTAVQKIKQKEVYEQQKELILLGERVVLATLGFDLNVQHPYKPLVEAIKKFKVAQNALAQVAWNFVNDGLRTSLCLQFKPHHIAAGAIFLAAKFLKVKLPSDGEKVWWQEFDVTPRQLEEVSNQMLELYEQNRVPPSSDVEGSAVSVATHWAPAKATNSNEAHVTTNSYSQTGSMRPGASKPALSRPASELSYAENHGGPPKATESRSNDYASTEMKNSDQNVDGKFKDNQHHEPVQLAYREKVEEAQNTSSRLDSKVAGEDHESNAGRSETREAGDKHFGRNLENRQGTLGRSPQEGIEKIYRDKVKATKERRRKSISDATRRTDSMNEEDLIERELEDVELAAGSEKTKSERRQNWLTSSSSPENEDLHQGKHQEGIRDEHYRGLKKQQSGPDLNNVEEGEVSVFDVSGFQSPKSNNRKRKAGSPLANDGQPQDKGRKPTGY